MSVTHRNIVLLGPPGAGKGTQASLLVKRLHVPHISTGNLLRDAIQQQTAIGLSVKSLIESGQLISDEIVVDLVAERLGRQDAESGFILDGFPRTVPQALALDQILNSTNSNLDCCLMLAIDTNRIMGRLAARAQLEHRADDTPPAIQERLMIFESTIAPLLTFYHRRKILTQIQGTGSIEEVAARIRQALCPGQFAVI
jgi:adenylate kinase